MTRDVHLTSSKTSLLRRTLSRKTAERWRNDWNAKHKNWPQNAMPPRQAPRHALHWDSRPRRRRDDVMRKSPNVRLCCLTKAAGSSAWSSGAISASCAQQQQDNYPQAHRYLSALWPQRSTAHPESGVSAVPQALPVSTCRLSPGKPNGPTTPPGGLLPVDHSLRNHNFFQLPKANSTIFQSSPLYFASHIFNILPKHIQSSTQLTEFKKKAQQYFLSPPAPAQCTPSHPCNLLSSHVKHTILYSFV